MTCLWMDGFDIYGSAGVAKMLDGLYAESNADGPSTTQVRTGTYSYKFPAGASRIMRRIFGGDKDVVGYGYGIYLSTLPISSTVLCLASFRNNANTEVCSLWLTTTGQIQLRTGGSGGAVQATTSPVIVATAWQHVEIKLTFHASLGACEIRVNGVTVMNASNVNTDTPAGGIAAQVAIFTQSSANPEFFIDDMFAWDDNGSYNNDFIGDKKVFTIWPNADTAQTDWVRDGGSDDYARINEDTPSDANYIAAATSGLVSEFGLEDLASNISAIAAIQTTTRTLKTDAGTSNVQTSLISNSIAVDGADRAITTNATYYTDVFEEDPDAVSAWTRTAVNAMLLRVARTA